MKKLLRTIGIGGSMILMLAAGPIYAEDSPDSESPDSPPFLDVDIDSPYYVALKFLKENDIIRGYGDSTFRPYQSVTRVEALSITMKSSKILPSQELQEVQQFTLPIDTVLNLSFPTETDISLKTPSMEAPITLEKTGVLELILPQGGILRAGRVYLDQDPIFTDIKKDTWYAPLIKRAVSLDIIKGYPDGTFKPEQNVNLVEALAILFRVNRIPLSNPSGIKLPDDVPEDAWYKPEVGYTIQRYIVNPTISNKIHPDKELSRGELAMIIYRFIKSQDNVQFGAASWYRDGMSKIKLTVNKEYAEQNLTAAHKEYGFGTVVRVMNLKNGKYVDVVINDRGPFLPGRIIDLSKTAFSTLETPSLGTVPVQVEVLSRP